jgi:hypothetical protein
MMRCKIINFYTERNTKMMEYNQIAKQTIDFQKTSFKSGYDAVAKIQDQAAEAVEMMVNQNSLVTEEGRQAVKSWIKACQEERNRFKSYVEDSFSGLEMLLAGERKSAPKKTKSVSVKPKN